MGKEKRELWNKGGKREKEAEDRSREEWDCQRKEEQEGDRRENIRRKRYEKRDKKQDNDGEEVQVKI